jgi:hypothetical protein
LAGAGASNEVPFVENHSTFDSSTQLVEKLHEALSMIAYILASVERLLHVINRPDEHRKHIGTGAKRS